MEQSPSHDLRVHPLQAGIDCSHFAKVEAEAWGGEMTSKTRILGAGPMLKSSSHPARIGCLPVPKSLPVLRLWGGGAVGYAKDRGPAILLLLGIRTLEPESWGSNPVSATE